MRLTRSEKRTVEKELVIVINRYPKGIDTRVLISTVMTTIAATIPNANRHHVSGMLSWVWKNYNYMFLVRTPGYSIIA